MPAILNGHELAAQVGVSYPQVMEWARDGLIPSIRCGRRVMFNLDRVVDAMRELSHNPEGALAVGA